MAEKIDYNIWTSRHDVRADDGCVQWYAEVEEMESERVIHTTGFHNTSWTALQSAHRWLNQRMAELAAATPKLEDTCFFCGGTGPCECYSN